MTLIANLEIIQGDNSSTEQFTVRNNDGSIIDISGADWVSEFTLRSGDIAGTVSLSGSLTKATPSGSANQVFQWRLTPTQTAALSVGRYFLSIQVANAALPDPVSQEIVQAELRILPQGVV